ncbi:hypothetical protein DFH06DRAFT_1303751 [Mycena polygramma]|nr:hypothetical protein DFH06DRAFT_1303751 [Mycena polygramma]
MGDEPRRQPQSRDGDAEDRLWRCLGTCRGGDELPVPARRQGQQRVSGQQRARWQTGGSGGSTHDVLTGSSKYGGQTRDGNAPTRYSVHRVAYSQKPKKKVCKRATGRTIRPRTRVVASGRLRARCVHGLVDAQGLPPRLRTGKIGDDRDEAGRKRSSQKLEPFGLRQREWSQPRRPERSRHNTGRGNGKQTDPARFVSLHVSMSFLRLLRVPRQLRGARKCQIRSQRAITWRDLRDSEGADIFVRVGRGHVYDAPGTIGTSKAERRPGNAEKRVRWRTRVADERGE